ncbi:hypothetical protein [Arthrobacter sp. NPDC057013]|uniref:hypothetical protein n=1 Tax=Arthrobacter sp. NPDC057013 TaxID=3345999 RepID=UPI00364228D7
MHSGNDDDTDAAGGAAVSHSVNQPPEDVLAYWTPERMAEAVPRDIRLPAAEDSGPRSEGK